ncbi:MAG: helix-turn-helix domain-containing protein [Candidatus Aerophobetes bacterium]|nr:helix-turn-helix domain-containing protein [Candidatus Aerophobetes bacterium]
MEAYTVKEVAESFKVYPFIITRCAREGKIPAFKVGKQWRFDKLEIEKWRKRQRRTNKYYPFQYTSRANVLALRDIAPFSRNLLYAGNVRGNPNIL